MWRVYTVNKRTKQLVEVIATNLTEDQAYSICECWGWNYCDENGQSYWIECEECI